MNVGLCVSSLLIVSILYGIINVFSVQKQQTLYLLKKSFSFCSVVFALLALELGGSMMLGTCEQAYSMGLFGLLYVVGITVGFLLLGFGFASKMKAMNVESTIDLFAIKYHSPFIRSSAAILSILTTSGLLIGQIVAAKSLVYALGIHNDFIFIALCLAVVAYTIWGGLKGAGITYSAQLIYTIILFGAIFGFCIFKEPPSFFYNFLSHQNLFTSNTISFSAIFASLVMPALYYLTDQEFAKPLFAITTKKEAALCTISASFFMLLFSFIPIYLGIKAKALNLCIGDNVSPLIAVLQILTNNIVVGLAVCGVAAALIAMIDYYLWAVSLSITYEIGLAHPAFADNKTFEKTMVVIIGVIAIGASYCTKSDAIAVLLYSYELYDSCLIVPLVMSYFQADLKKGSAIGAFLFGLTSFILFRFITIPIPQQVASLSLSLLGFYLGGIIEKLVSNFNKGQILLSLYSRLQRYNWNHRIH